VQRAPAWSEAPMALPLGRPLSVLASALVPSLG